MTTHKKSKKTQGLFASLKNPANVKKAWDLFQKIPGGKLLFSKIMGLIIPYTGKMSAKVVKIEKGYAEVELTDCRKVRNHLNSIHALALANLGEFCSGLALFSQCPKEAQAILVKLETSYLKKARGLLTAHAHFKNTSFQSDTDYVLTTEIKDKSKDLVALVNTTWRIRLV